MAFRQTKNGKWLWDFYPQGRKGKRIKRVLPDHIKTRQEAEQYAANLRLLMPDELSDGYASAFKFGKHTSVNELFMEALEYFKIQHDNDIAGYKRAIKDIVGFFKTYSLSVRECFNLSPNFVESYIQYRLKSAPPKKINYELRVLRKSHDFWASKEYCKPLSFDILKFYLKDEKETAHHSEKFYERLIELFPSVFLDEELTFIEKPIPLLSIVPDSLFSTKNNEYIIVEIQKDRLDRTHAYKILEYRDKIEKYFSDNGNNPAIRMMVVVIGAQCSIERREFLTKYGVELKLLSIPEIEEKILSLLSQKFKGHQEGTKDHILNLK